LAGRQLTEDLARPNHQAPDRLVHEPFLEAAR
jgi:hypothetical protein